MRTLRISAAVLLLVFTVNIARAQIPLRPEPSYTPYSAGTRFVSDPEKGQGPSVTAKTTPDPYIAPGLGCLKAPSPQQTIAAGFTYHSRVISTADAIRLNIPFYVSGSGKVGTMIVVRDYVSSLPCTASDGKTILRYGQAIRTILTIENYEAKLGTSLQMIAADATMNHKSTKLDIQVLGLDNPKFQDQVATIAGKDFTVDNYPAYLAIESDMVKLVRDSQTSSTSVQVGIDSPTSLDETQLRQASSVAWALTQIRAGHPCNIALAALNGETESQREAITVTYQTVTGQCDSSKPERDQKESAKKFLGGLKAAKQ